MSTYQPSYFAVLVNNGGQFPAIQEASSMSDACQKQSFLIKEGYLGALLVAGKASYISLKTIVELNSFNPEIGSYIQ